MYNSRCHLVYREIPFTFELATPRKSCERKFHPAGSGLLQQPSESKAGTTTSDQIAKLATRCAAVKKRRPPYPRKTLNGVQLFFVGPVAKCVDELVRAGKIQRKLYGIDCQNVISFVRTVERLSQASCVGPATWIAGTGHRVAAQTLCR